MKRKKWKKSGLRTNEIERIRDRERVLSTKSGRPLGKRDHVAYSKRLSSEERQFQKVFDDQTLGHRQRGRSLPNGERIAPKELDDLHNPSSIDIMAPYIEPSVMKTVKRLPESQRVAPMSQENSFAEDKSLNKDSTRRVQVQSPTDLDNIALRDADKVSEVEMSSSKQASVRMARHQFPAVIDKIDCERNPGTGMNVEAKKVMRNVERQVEEFQKSRRRQDPNSIFKPKK